MDDAQSRRRRDIPGTAQCCLGCEPRPKGQNCARRDLHGGQLVAQESGFVYLVNGAMLPGSTHREDDMFPGLASGWGRQLF
jgi:hypothetical protein